ncbi:MAG: hydrogenase maturation nickel metallochaperone HypA [Kiritimatiellales bacterium]|nr:hydrogenase maturation nickel metallochaperone HypA [Kiritimatiellota bacterium]MBL7011471.1 hydrogenase maturation nickel metallochaperone HypA [Kiritimatiellales bacterium]
MHELSLACSLIEEAEKVLEAENAARVIRITLGIGKLSGVEIDAFEFAFPMAAKGSRLEEAALVINDLPIHVRCKVCEKESNPDFPHCICAVCGSDDIELLGGREFNIESMEIE